MVGYKFGTKLFRSIGNHARVLIRSLGLLREDLEQRNSSRTVKSIALGRLGIDTLLRVHGHGLLLKLYDVINIQSAHIAT